MCFDFTKMTPTKGRRFFGGHVFILFYSGTLGEIWASLGEIWAKNGA